MKKICVIGGINVDLVSLLDRFPNPGETMLSEKFEMFPGGKGSNQVVSLAKLGADALMLGKVGADAFGEISLKNFEKNNVIYGDVSIIKGESTGVAVIGVTKSGENNIIFTRGVNSTVDPEYIASKFHIIDQCDIIMMQLGIPVATAEFVAEYATKRGKIVILDPSPAEVFSDNLLGNITILTPNETEMKIATGHSASDDINAESSAQSLFDAGVDIIINKAGPDGAYIMDKDGYRHIPGYSVNVLDTTAAGDSFNAGLAYALATGMNIDESVKFGHAVGAISVTKLGAQSAMPSIEDVNEFIKNK